MFKRNDLLKKMEIENMDGFMVTGSWNSRYLTGLPESSDVLLFTKDSNMLITDYRYTEQAREQTDYDVILHAGHTGHQGKIFNEVAKQVNDLGIKRLGFEQRHVCFGDYQKISALMQAELIPTYDFVEDIRMVKTASELELLRVASQITDDAYVHVLNHMAPGMKESELSSELERYIEAQGGNTTGFPPIVASGIRSSLPHGRATDKVMKQGEMVTIDFGANYQGYWSDISRTVSLGEPDSHIKEVQEIVLHSFQHCVQRIRAGLTDQEVDRLMREHIIEKGYNDLSGTGTGHGIGLEVHEKPLFSVMEEKKLKPNMTVTVEPGIYLPGKGGARVEDVLLIKEDGCETLTPSTKELVIL